MTWASSFFVASLYLVKLLVHEHSARHAVIMRQSAASVQYCKLTKAVR